MFVAGWGEIGAGDPASFMIGTGEKFFATYGEVIARSNAL